MFFDFHTHHLKPNGLFNLGALQVNLPDTPCSIGAHPWWLAQYDKTLLLRWVEEHVNHPCIAAIGECGLDKATSTPLEEQVAIFSQHLQWAKKHRKPLIIHCVRAYQECLHLIKTAQLTEAVIFHGFHGSLQLAQQITKAGHYLSIGPIKEESDWAKTIAQLPIDSIVLETDDSALGIDQVYGQFARIKEMTSDQLKSIMNQRALAIFGTQILNTYGS